MPRKGGRWHHQDEVVYFISDGTAVKVGTTRRDIESRLRALQTGNPRTLRLLAAIPGGEVVEKRIHTALDAHRLSGEWFDSAVALRYLIENHHDRLLPL